MLNAAILKVRMQIENFKIFADLVETKSFSKAAKLNGITQSAVSQQARSMERTFQDADDRPQPEAVQADPRGSAHL
jgi:predicted transcriptional regulator